MASALRAAWDGDRVSAFGSVIACTGIFDREAAEFLTGKMVEAILAPDFTAEALDILRKKKNIMLMKINIAGNGAPGRALREALGGMLVQDSDNQLWDKWEVVTRAGFGDVSRELAEFSMTACKYTKSNAIVLCEEYEPGYYHVLGMGAGQPNRVDSLRKLAATKARENLETALEESGKPVSDIEEWIKKRMGETVMASDAFFPFEDTVREAAALGIKYIIQPGGSVRDSEVIAAANELGIAMVFTGTRHFLH
jgi:phosphoribosylaminoimidazolecarboxamide formyltransferase/IMP cyclohydrolase